MSQKKIGAKIVIDGEQEFRQALLNSKNAMKEFDSEMKLVTAQFKKNEQSMEALRAKQAVYQKQQQELTKQSKILVEQIQKANVEYKKAAEVQEKQAEKVKKLEKALEEAKKEYGDSATEVQDLERELSEANEEYTKQQRALDQLTNKITKWNTDLNKTQTELVQTDQALEDTNDAIADYDKGLDRAESETEEFGNTMGGAAKNTESLRVSLGSLISAQVVVDVLRNCARAIKEVATAAVEVGAKFEASMSNVEALSGASGASLEKLGEKAREMGAKTIYSASQSADAFSYMALAGWDVEQMLQGIEPVLNLAAAANMELAEASDIVTDYITAFGLKADDAAHFSDAMAKAMSTSNTTVELLGESYKNCAATCGSMGIAMEDATAVLATMANAGVKGGEAGTALNTILTRLATNTKDCGDKLRDYGVEVYDQEGRMNSLSSILNGLAEVWGDLSQKEQASLAKTIAGVNQYSKFQTIMIGVSEAAKEGGQSFDDYANALRNCDGAAEQMAKTMQDNLMGDVTILKSALEGLGIATEGVFDESFRTAVQGATDAVARLEREVSHGNLGVSLANLGDSVARLTANLLDASEEALPGFIDGLTWIVDHLGEIGSAIKVVVASFAAYKIATIAATVSTEGFTAALMSNPIGAAAVALTALTVATIEYSEAMRDSSNWLTKEGEETVRVTEELQDLNTRLRDSSDARADEVAQMEAQASAAQKLVGELFNETTEQSRRAQIISELKTIYPQLNIAMDEHGKLLGATQQQMQKYIDTSLQMAKVEAAKEHLTEIAKDQFEAEQKLSEIQEKRQAAVLNLKSVEQDEAEARKKYLDNMMAPMGLNMFNETVAASASKGAQVARDALAALDEQQQQTRDSITDLGEEYQKTLDYINDNEPIVNATEAAEDLARAEEDVKGVSEELEQEFKELYESVEKSISSSLDLTNKWAAEWKTSTAEMTTNIESQIKGIQDWEQNFDALANSAEVNLDQRVLKYLADMGVEGAGLVQELVNTLKQSPEDLQDFNDRMAEYLTLEDSAAAAITSSYEEAVASGTAKAKAAADKGLDEVTSVAEQRGQEFAETMARAGESATTDFKSSLDDGSGEVEAAAQNMGERVANSFKEKAGKDQGQKSGAEYDAGIAEGLNEGNAEKASEENSKAIYEAYAKTLTASAGSNIGNSFMGAMAEAFRSKSADLISQANALAAEIRRILDEAAAYKPTIPTNPGGPGGNTPPGFAEGLPYVPYDDFLARLHKGERVLTKEENEEYTKAQREKVGNVQNPAFNASQSRIMQIYDQTFGAIDRLGQAISKNSNDSAPVAVNVELYGDAKDIFKVVRAQNTKLVTATGYHALG